MNNQIKATASGGLFSMECSVTCMIKAPAGRIWEILTDASRFTAWNSTLTRMEGRIAPGETVKLEAKSAPGRTFKLKVTSFEPSKSMTWEDGFAPMFKGKRVYSLADNGGANTKFTMTETFSGLMLPMIKGSLPDFVPIFEQYAADLKREAEKNN